MNRATCSRALGSRLLLAAVFACLLAGSGMITAYADDQESAETTEVEQEGGENGDTKRSSADSVEGSATVAEDGSSLLQLPSNASSAIGTEQQISPFLRDAKVPSVQSPDSSNSGAFVYQYPLEVPPGRLGMQPNLTLTYSSQDHAYDDMFGYGWGLNIPYIERLNSSGLEDMYTPTAKSFVSSMSGELATTTVANAYVARSDDGSYLRYALTNNVWTAMDKNGTVYTFGTTTASRQNDPADATRIYKWMLQEEKDTNGNTVTYTYAKDSGQIYPATVTYTGNATTTGAFVITFSRSLSATPPALMDSTGFPVQTRYQIADLSVAANGEQVKKYHFTYGTGDNGGQRVLSNIAVTGYNGGTPTTLPPSEFTYTHATKDWEVEQDWQIPFKFVSDSRDYGGDLTDIDGDGLTDIVRAEESYDGDHSSYSVYLRLGGANDGWSRIDSADHLACPLTLYDEDDDTKQYDSGARLLDLNGDHRVDLLCNDDKAYLNTGILTEQWDESSQWESPEQIVYSDEGRDKGVRFPDLNGDGLPDLVRAYISDDDVEIVKAYLNTGNGWSHSQAWEDALEDTGMYFSSEAMHDTGVRVADVNGDGLDDILGGEYDEYGPDDAVLINTGNGWEEDSAWHLPYPVGRNYVRLMDITGDGLVDIVAAADLTNDSDRELVYVNTGNGWNHDSNIQSPIPFTVDDQDAGTRIGEFNGDGIPDFVTYGSGKEYGGNDWTYNEVNLSTGNTSNLISTTEDSYGAVTTPAYGGSTSQDGYLTYPLNPIVVTAITKNDGVTDTTESYTYTNGGFDYDGPFDRHPTGFGHIQATDAQGNVTTSDFLGKESADALIGKPTSVSQSDASGNLYKQTAYQWQTSTMPQGGDGRFALKSVSTELAYDGDASHRDTATSYSYDGFGNASLVQDWGEVTAALDGSFTDIGTDKVSTEFAYASSSAGTILGRPYRRTTLDQASTKIAEDRYTYDTLPYQSVSIGNLTKQQGWIKGNQFASTQHAYNTFGLPTSTTDPRGNVTQYAYDAYKLYVATSTNALGQTDTYTYDYSSGATRLHTDVNHQTFESVYDGLDRLVSALIPDPQAPQNRVAKYTLAYDTSPFPKVTRTDNLDGTVGVQTISYYDRFMRPLQERRQTETANSYAVTDHTYNSLGLLASESLPYFSNGAGKTNPKKTASLLTKYAYDALDRIKKLTTSDGDATYAYDDWSTTTTDPLTNVKSASYDARGNLSSVDEHNDAAMYTTTYGRDGLGNLTGITDSMGNVRAFTYDGLSRVTKAEDLHSPADSSFGIWNYAYDAAGNLATSTSPRGKAVTYTYDALNRVKTEDNSDTSYIDVNYGYDASIPYAIGKLASVSTGSIGSSYYYDANSNLSAELHIIPGTATTTTTYTYDRQANPVLVGYPDGTYTYNGYNAGGLLEYVQISTTTNAWSYIVSNIDYAPTGAASVMQYANNTITYNTYDPMQRYRLTQKAAYSPTLYFQNNTYGYDHAGNVQTITEASNVNAPKAITYSYDDLYRLTSATTTSTTTDPGYLKSFTYNALGGLLTKDGKSYLYKGSLGGSYANPHAPTKVGTATLTYDQDGNLLTDAITNYTWNYKDELTKTISAIGTSTVTTTYAYDQNGQRILKGSAAYGTSTYPTKYYGTRGTNTTYKNIYAGDTLVATLNKVGSSTGTLSYIYTDHLGSTNVVADASGTPTRVFDYYPYGEERVDTNPSSTKTQQEYIGQIHDDESALNYLNARYQDPGRGQFVSEDPVFWELGQSEEGKAVLMNPQAMNSYSYGGDNPVTYSDPQGRLYGFETFANSRPQYTSDQIQASGYLNLPYYYRQAGDPTGTLRINDQKFQDVGSITAALLLLKTGSFGSLTSESAISSAAAQLQMNRAAGSAFEAASAVKISETYPISWSQVTLRAGDGTVTRPDFIVRDSAGNYCIFECKASATASLTKNQALAFPQIYTGGATVLGNGKIGLPGGTLIPPSPYIILRP